MLRVEKLDGGPKAVAATLAPKVAARVKQRLKLKKAERMRWSQRRLILEQETEAGDARLRAAAELLDEIE
jgi:hypothetical protein